MKKFEYKGPEKIAICKDCLYCQFGSDEEYHCFHPDSPDIERWSFNENILPNWCPLPDDELEHVLPPEPDFFSEIRYFNSIEEYKIGKDIVRTLIELAEMIHPDEINKWEAEGGKIIDG